MNSSDLTQRRARLTPEQRKKLAQRLTGANAPARQPNIPRRDSTGPAPLSYAQQRHWFLWQLEPLSTAYHISGGLRLVGKLDIEALRSSFEALGRRHESLRTVFRANAEGLPEQIIEDESGLDILLIDFSNLSAEQGRVRGYEEANRINATPFDLTQGPLLRLALIRIAPEEHLLVVVMHHIISDAWSNRIVIDEFAAHYRLRVQQEGEGQEPSLPALTIQYADYAVWQRNWLEAGEKDRQLAYWRSQLGEEHPVLQLPTDHPRPSVASYRAGRHIFMLPAGLVVGLQRQAQSQGATLFMALLAGFQALLHRYSEQHDIRVGVPVANRHRFEIENIIGLFVNTQVLRARIDGRMSLKAILNEVREAALGAQTHQDLPFEQLVEALQPERNLNQNPLFQVMYNHLREDYRALERLPGLTVEDHELSKQAAQFELTLDTVEYPDGRLEAIFTYAAELFESATIERLGERYLHLLEQLAGHPERSLGDIDILSEAERGQLRAWGVNDRRYGDTEPVHRLIERQVEARPEAVALIFGDTELSYAELNRRANCLAHRLMSLGVKPETRVGIAVERSIEMVVGLLAILKAGGAYVPLDPEYPRERLDYMVGDSGIGLLLTQSHIKSRIPHSSGCEVLELDVLDLEDEPESNPQVSLHGQNLAYVIYTSGSTGKPKGVGNRHCSLYNRLVWMQEAHVLNHGDTVLQKTPFSFDVSVWEFFWPLMHGARLAVASPGDHRDPARLLALIQRHHVTTLHFVPSMLQAFVAHEGIEVCTSLRRIICSGEALPAEMEKKVFGKLPGVGLYNLYGPTEAAIDVTQWECVDKGDSNVPIGQPITDTQTYILDAHLNQVPGGVAGELYLGGVGLARGYLNRGGLTAERFIADPFDEEGGRLYRTGDLARWRADGQIEYLGRLDHQVKIRGFRIELGEIETQLLAQPEIREAVVIAREAEGAGGGARLVGYVSPHCGASVDAALMREALAKALPDYMIPSAIVVLESLPLNPNGKVDRKALPEPEFVGTVDYEAPQGEVEEALAGIWAQVLGVGQVGRNDNFFELGGDSILSLQIVTKARRAGWKITPRQLFERQTIASLATIAATVQEAAASVQRKEGAGTGSADGLVPLLPIQAEFFEQEIPARHHWNQAALLKSRQPLDPGHLDRALEAVVRHHDALRFRYTQNESGNWQQFPGESAACDLLWIRRAATEVDLEALCTEAQRSLDLTEGPLLRALLIDMPDGGQRLLLAIHHLVIDGVSWRILLEDLQTAYSQARTSNAITLPAHTAGYEEWTRRLQGCAREYTEELAYWQSLADWPVVLPADNPQGTNIVRHRISATLRLDRTLTRTLLKQAPAAYRTHVNDLLLTALGSALCRWSGHKKILVDLEGHGREDLYDIDLSQTVGWFTSLYPVALDPSGNLDQRIKRIKESLRRIPNRGLGYGVLKYNGTPEQRKVLASLPRAEVVFNYLGQFDASFDEKALWMLADESVGDSMDEAAPLEHEISINGSVYGGELSLDVSYSEARYEKATIEVFINLYRAELEALIAHCTGDVHGVTPSDFPLAGITQQELDRLPVPPAQLEDLYPLSPMQSGILFHSVFDADAGIYLNQLRVDIEGLDVKRFKAGWQAAMDRHEVLRTGFLAQGDVPLQWVAKTVEVPFVEYDWWNQASGLPGDQERDLEVLAQSEHALGFDLAKPPLMRLALVRIADNRHHLIWTIHHLLLDGWSTSQLTGEVLRHYAGSALPASGGRYRDFIEWLHACDAKVSEAYWRERLREAAEPTRLADVLPAPSISAGNTAYGEHATALERTVTEGLIEFAKRERVTVNTLVQAAWALLLNRYTGRKTVCFGVTVAGRPADLPGAERLLGLFINTLPMIAMLQPEQETGTWLRDLQAQNLASREHEHTPLYEIQRWLGQSGQGLFDSILVFENYPVDEVLQQSAPGGLVFSGIRNRETTNYPMTISVMQSDTLYLHYSYARRHFSADVVNCIGDQVIRLLRQIAQSPTLQLGDIDILSEAERGQLRAWGVNDRRYGDTEPVHRLIERQVEARPEAVALIFGDTELSYAELNRRANCLAHRLMSLGVKPETRVGIAVERSIEMVVGLLAILKAGGAYVPLDPEYPRERLDYMVTDSALGLLLTQSHIRGRIPQSAQCEVLELDVLDLDGESERNPAVSLHGDNFAYVIYTSGSTGKPKGVGVPHHALAEHAQVAVGFFCLASSDRMLQFSTINFDGFIEQLFPPLCVGAGVVLRGPMLWDSDTFYHELINKRITVADLTTAYWFLLVQDFARIGPRDYGLLRQVHAGGEAMSPEGLIAWKHAGFDGVTLLNTYGPTEAAVTATACDCSNYSRGNEAVLTKVAIGKPLAGRNIYLLDANLTPVPSGIPGELCIGGDLLARGYLNRGGLTAERFIADPFDEEGGRLYRTGDLARWRADGQIEYLGRLDHQVKIRGFRIELGEIEAQLLIQPDVREAVVIAGEGPSGARLVGYVSPHAGKNVDIVRLREALAKVLPDYMIPSAIVVLESLPLNPNGKVDRKALPEPEFVGTVDYEAPQGEVEEALAGIWAQVLGVGQVGRNDNFFELGGDSILSLQIVTKARRAGWKITPRQLFERQTITSLSKVTEAIQEPAEVVARRQRGYLRDYLRTEAISMLAFTDDEIEDIYPLSPTQEGMLFHTLEATGTGLYVNQISVEVEGLEPKRLADAWRAMVARHPVLRTGFLWQAGLARPLQIIFKQVDVPVVHLDWRGLDQLESRIAVYAEEDLTREFDFLAPPLVRLAFIRIADDRYHLVWTKHHILLDGWSDSMLISEWLRCYGGETLVAPGPDYGHYVHWLARQDVQATKVFWQTELRGIEGATILAQATNRLGKRKEGDKRSGFAQIYTRLNPEETLQLKAFAQRRQVTLNTVIQAAWALLLQRYTGKDTVVFGATVAGRPPSLPKADEILGLFINTIPVPVERRSELTVVEYLSLLQKTNARLREHEHASLAEVQRWAGSPGQSLFDSIVVFENYPIDEAMRGNELYGLRFGEVEGKGLTGYAMDLQVVVGEMLEIEYCYGQANIPDEFALEIREHMEFLMREMVAHPQRVIGELGWMEGVKPDHLFSLGSTTRTPGLSQLPHLPVHRLIEQNAVEQPEAIALLMGERELCYGELNMRANRLAHKLVSMGMGPDVRVGVAMERSLEVIVTLLAVLKAGGAYVPLDPEYPAERLSFMIKDSGMSLLLTEEKLLRKLGSDAKVRPLALDSLDVTAESSQNPSIPLHEHNLAYIIYTSGSTGLPKGVAVAHGPLSMHCRATAEIYGMTPHSCELLFMSFSFDGAHERWLTALTVGAGLAVRDQELWTAEQTYDALHNYGITNAAFPPAYLGQVAEWAAPRSDPPPVELYVFGGEAMPKASYDLVRKTLRPRILINGYGPTETVVTPLIWKTEASNSFDCAYAPIGRPVGERTAYVLDVDMQPVPVGVVGELYIGGYGLARGYLGRTGMTAERFVADPFDANGGRLYRTGDLVRWLDDGNIEYIGRADHQVKIRGFRIELGEIEACIRELHETGDVAVVVYDGPTGPQLVAYVVPVAAASAAPVQGEATHDFSAELKQQLAKRLPDYMVPAHILMLETLPRLPSGKLNRDGLPEPGAVASDIYRVPSTPEARLLAQIWQEVLGVERVGETDNFFALGGDSLSSLKVMARMRNVPGAKFDFKLRDLMQRPSIADLLGLDMQAPAETQTLLLLNQPGEKAKAEPLFCIHAGFGTVFDYQPLARQLHGKRTVYGLPSRMLANPAHSDTSLAQMAADYCQIIRQMQPEGPYHLLGWSLGGTLAAMIAASLEAEAQTVAFLGLIDPFIPDVDEPEPDDWRQDFFDFVSVALPGAKIEGVGSVYSNDNVTGVEQPSEQIISSLLEALILAEQARRGTGGSSSAEVGGYADMGAGELARIFTVARHLKALAAQAPSLSRLNIPPSCWWVAARPLSDRSALARQIDQVEPVSNEINTDHFAIVRASPLLLGIKSALEDLYSQSTFLPT